jgi:hypothetical protein
MAEMKFSEEELKSIKSLRDEYSELSIALGQLEIEKLLIKSKEDNLHSIFSSVLEKERKIIQDLNAKYGVGSLNLDTGTFTPNP